MNGRRGTFDEDLQRCISRGRRSTRDMFIRDVRRSGRRFLERGCILERPIFRFAKIILRDTFSWQAQYFRQMEWKNGKTQWYQAVSSALNIPFLKEVLQNCFVLNVDNCKNSGSLAEFHRFGVVNFNFLRKSCRIASFLMLSPSKMEEVSQNSFVLKLAGTQIDR